MLEWRTRHELGLESAPDLMQSMAELHALSTRLISCTSADDAINAILDAAISLHDAQFGNVQLFRPEAGLLEIVAHRGFDDAFLDRFKSVSIETPCACGRALRARTTIVIDDVAMDAEYAPFVDIALKAGYRAVQSTPMIATDGRFVGILSTHFAKPLTLPSAKLQVTQFFAQQSADMILQLRGVEENIERQKLLTGELSHRVKNLLMMVLAVSRRTKKESSDLNEFSDVFEDRLTAMGRAHDVLRQSDWKSTLVKTLVREQLSSFSLSRIRQSGPDIAITPDATYILSLILHELGVNAFKHGALGAEDGRVAIEWTVETKRGILQLDWRELDGPTVKPPAREGFGSALLRNLIESNLVDGVFDYKPSGLQCSLRLPNALAASSITEMRREASN